MTQTEQTLTTIAAGLVALWLWKRHRNRPQPVAPVRNLFPKNPDTVRPWLTIPGKRGGNAPQRPSVASSLGTQTDPAGAPDGPLKTLQPRRAAFAPPGKVMLPNLGDGRYKGFEFLSTTPPDLAWGLKVRRNG